MLTTEQLQALADGEASKMYSPDMARELHARLARAGALGEIAWQLRLAAREKWERGYCLRRTDLEKQLKKDDCGLNWGWAEVWTRFGERSTRRAAEPTIVLVIDLPIGQLVLNDDYHTGLRPPEYHGQIEYDELTDLRIAAFVELVLQYRTPEEVCYAIACLAASTDDDESTTFPASGLVMSDELDANTPDATDEALE